MNDYDLSTAANARNGDSIKIPGEAATHVIASVQRNGPNVALVFDDGGRWFGQSDATISIRLV